MKFYFNVAASTVLEEAEDDMSNKNISFALDASRIFASSSIIVPEMFNAKCNEVLSTGKGHCFQCLG